jgi:hypothetical protein
MHPRSGRALDRGDLVSDPFDAEALQREIILRNEKERPGYAPYCMRCRGLVRMRVVELHYWRCHCGAQCDYRTPIAPEGDHP